MKQPNFIVILTDDQGYGDLSCMGAEDFVTPNLDRLAASGARFTSWYASSPVCSPSRASLLTGRYPAKAGVRGILPGHREAWGLRPEVPTLSSELKKLGYQTAHFGKWHLGVREECRPHQHGFDEWMGFLSGCIDYYSHVFYWGLGNWDEPVNPVHDLWRNNEEFFEDGRYFTEMITECAVDYIRKAAQKDRPFFVYVAYNAPHYPMHAPQKYTKRFQHLPWDRRMMAAMLSAVDDGVGDIVDELERQGMLEDTCIFFQSDNGPSRESRNWMDGKEDPYYGGTAGQLRGHKFSLFEGGIRVPAIISWPQRIPAGQVVHEAGIATDVFPTLIKAAGGDISGYECDGMDILPALCGEGSIPERELFWEYEEQTAFREGDFKLVLNGRLEEGTPPEDAVHLANLADDLGERVNLKDVYPEITERMVKAAVKWRQGMEERRG